MMKLLSLIITVTLLSGIVITEVSAIPTRDRQAVIEELNAYGIGVLDHYPSREPTTADDYYKLGVAYLFRNMSQAAAEQFRKALELNPEHVDSLIGLAASTAQLGDMEAALKYSSQAIKVQPNSAKVHNAVGSLRLASATSPEDLNEAEAKFKKAISLDSRFVPSHMNLARLYISMRKPDAAIKEYEAVIAIQPENLAAHAELARAHLNAGSLDKATEEAEKTVELSPQNPVSHNILGEMYARKGQLDEALAEFQKAVQIEPTYAPGYKNIGHVYLLMSSPDKAIEEYSKALSYRPNYGEVYSGLGDAYLTKGMTQKAVEGYKSSISEDAIRTLPIRALISVYNNLAYIYAEEERDLDEALSFAQKASQVAPKHPGIADTLGWVYYKKGLYSEAMANLEVAIEGMPDNPTVRYHLGAAYYRQGVKDKAAVELRKALSTNDKFEGAEDAKRLLAELELTTD